jgi:hypothetical protein
VACKKLERELHKLLPLLLLPLQLPSPLCIPAPPPASSTTTAAMSGVEQAENGDR